MPPAASAATSSPALIPTALFGALSRPWHLAYCAAGIICLNLAWGVVQERVGATDYCDAAGARCERFRGGIPVMGLMQAAAASLVGFAAMLAQLATQGVAVTRYNLGKQPMAFAENPSVKALLDREGPAALPLVFLDGEIRFKGRYPTHDERPAFFRAALGQDEKVPS